MLNQDYEFFQGGVEMKMANPKAFVSHASEDKERFVIGFAEKLRENGVDAWLDKWEMLPGDSLVDKIFEEGIKEASAFVIVLSQHSVDKEWVREELNVGFVRRIAKQSRLIPVVIDQCDIPQCLVATKWIRIRNLAEYSGELQEIINSIYGRYDKPELGEMPPESKIEAKLSALGLSNVDAIVLEALCEASLAERFGFVPFPNDQMDKLLDCGLSEKDIADSLTVLSEDYLIETSKVMGGGAYCGNFSHARIPVSTFHDFLSLSHPEELECLPKIISLIVNEDKTASGDHYDIGYSKRVVDHCVDLLECHGFLKVSRHSSGYSLWGISPKLARAVADGEF